MNGHRLYVKEIGLYDLNLLSKLKNYQIMFQKMTIIVKILP